MVQLCFKHLLFFWEKQTRSVERHIRKMEFHISKVSLVPGCLRVGSAQPLSLLGLCWVAGASRPPLSRGRALRVLSGWRKSREQELQGLSSERPHAQS